MPSLPSNRTPPTIRDHEVIRMIGRGAYGEVWMARSLTGTLRAVKVIWREDYDQPEAFERELQALKHYEPLSRKHPGLVPVLQVGRSEDGAFYYYVMELADDLDRGRDFDAETYRPHTLTAQMKRDKRIKAEACLAAGANIAEGLHYLHESGLIHRDVKPSNLVFINKQCCLADIGLITLLGQRTFVGTEGFCAPEGPGTAAADIFSLGMVLYEASTGKDRLDFPDLPTHRESKGSLVTWRRLHEAICTACAPKAGQRFESAREMAMALRGEELPSRARRLIWIAAITAAACFMGIGAWITGMRQPGGALAGTTQVVAQPLLTLRSEPTGAEVYAGEDLLGNTPLELMPTEGVPTIYHLRKQGFKHYELEHTAESGKPVNMQVKLEPSKLPQAGERWTNSLGIEFVPRQGGHASKMPVQMDSFREFVDDDHPFEGRVVRFDSNGQSAYIVVVPASDADAFRYWMTDRDRREGWLSQEHHYEIEPFYYVETKSDEPSESMPTDEPEPKSEGIAFYLKVERQTYGRVMLRTQPAGVHVFQHDQSLGDTPLELPRVRSGAVEFELRMEGFTDLVVEGEVKEGEILELYSDMEKRQGVTYGREWRNAAGQRFVPVGLADLLMAAHETRQRDYREFARANGRRPPPSPDEQNAKNASLPVVNVSVQDARDFCAWLTKRDQEADLLSKDDIYRLPTDEEWSRAVGLPLERGATPADRHARIRGIYPWGFEWPPPDHVDNLADGQAAKKAGLDAVIPGYEDGHPSSAPVGSLPPNDRGVCGLGGNVSEWVDTDYEKGVPTPRCTARGGNWRTANADEALSSFRIALPPNEKRNTIGFRIVVARKTAAP